MRPRPAERLQGQPHRDVEQDDQLDEGGLEHGAGPAVDHARRRHDREDRHGVAAAPQQRDREAEAHQKISQPGDLRVGRDVAPAAVGVDEGGGHEEAGDQQSPRRAGGAGRRRAPAGSTLEVLGEGGSGLGRGLILVQSSSYRDSPMGMSYVAALEECRRRRDDHGRPQGECEQGRARGDGVLRPGSTEPRELAAWAGKYLMAVSTAPKGSIARTSGRIRTARRTRRSRRAPSGAGRRGRARSGSGG